MNKHTFVPAFRAILIFTILTGLVTLAGCSSTAKRHDSTSKSSTLFPQTGNQSKTQKKLDKHFRNWERTPYKLGSLSKNGIDCSGFVYLTFRKVFSKTVPRTTKLLARYGNNISKNQLRLGDLVFFKTGRYQRHVGIYIGSGKFIHASTSQGVMQSNIRSSYWKKHYWMAKRVLS